ncbi:uncharacterized protein BDR25DRAFT_212090 [Lindgomyces ingoldianus]|uniref:Uncharacterized protein n=1 Tax=Lindgomyces ingoldianus TaxID=673940 RepID=A0ACB6R9I3_9PLEO|nr:uncharacterized protein BDR25DRAFT_212090 [Lindgomyces ingoldianus]KAF2475983.1 hypothetical protein BDR25DRAFT_212090 [Lindgomyces ingoldianus]
MPLSNHGMPKTPLPTSPKGSIRSHRFGSLKSPVSPGPASPPLSPPMSPPMSARSFGTFIESAPSTPAFSPRPLSSHWDSSTLVLLSPLSPQSAPKSPTDPSPVEPEWEMMPPSRRPAPEELFRPEQLSPRPASDPFVPPKPWYPAKRVDDPSQKENQPPTSGETTEDADAEGNAREEQSNSAAFGKLATRMKSILRRKAPGEKKIKKQRRHEQDLDYMEDVHWSEM